MGVLRLGDAAYGAAIRQEIHARSGRDVSISAVYTTLDRLEAKGLLSSWIGAPTAAARRPPPQVLRAAAGRHGGAAAGLPRDHGDGRRARSPAGDRMSAPLPALDRLAAVAAPVRRAGARSSLGDLAEEYRGPRRGRAGRRPSLAVVAGGALPGVAAARIRTPAAPAVAARGETPDAADARRRCPLCRPRPRAGAVVHARRRRRCSRSASAPRPRSSASSTPCCCGRCRSTSPIGWCGCSTCRRRPPSPASRASRCRRPTSTTGSGRRTAFEGMALYRGRSFTLTGSGAPRSINVATVGAGFFDDPARPAGAGARCSAPTRTRPAPDVVVISDGFWRTQMGGARACVGRTPDARRRGLHHRRRHAGRASRWRRGPRWPATCGCRSR